MHVCREIYKYLIFYVVLLKLIYFEISVKHDVKKISLAIYHLFSSCILWIGRIKLETGYSHASSFCCRQMLLLEYENVRMFGWSFSAKRTIIARKLFTRPFTFFINDGIQALTDNLQIYISLWLDHLLPFFQITSTWKHEKSHFSFVALNRGYKICKFFYSSKN